MIYQENGLKDHFKIKLGEILKAKEDQNQCQFDNYEENKFSFGPFSSHILRDDPRHIVFMLSRYKFVSKMLEGKKRVVEIGCGDAIGMPIITQTVDYVLGCDWEELLMEGNKKRNKNLNCDFFTCDITNTIPDISKGKFDAAFSLDVIEHIPNENEHKYFENITKALKEDGVFIIGTPNITANQYASVLSKAGHINLHSHKTLKEKMEKYFKNCFCFSMNDEMVHTGFGPMAHYIFIMGVGLK